MPNPLSHAPSRAGLLAAHLTEAGWLGLLVVVPLVMNVAAARTFEAAKLAAAAPIAALMLFALIAAVIEKQARLPHGITRQPAFWAFATLISAAVTATALSETPWIAFFGDYFRREGLVSWLIYATVFAAMTLLIRGRDQLDRVVDALLLASVIPCVYALQQRFGYDFFSTAGLQGGTVGSRPGSNLGNPTFLSAYLLLIIPLTIARLVNTAGAWRVRAPWLALLGVQLFSAILTQSRGPLLGLIAVLFLLAVVLGGLLRMRGLILAAVGAGALVMVGLIALNLTPDLQAWVKGTPFQRFIFTGGQDLTANSRIGIWNAGADAFVHQPLWRQLIGWGADATHFNYFTHMATWVMRIEGLTETIDRLHDETMETAMTFGLVGLSAQMLLLSSLVWLGVARIGRLGRLGAGGVPGGPDVPVSTGGTGGFAGPPAVVWFTLACLGMAAGGAWAFMSIGGSRGLFAIGGGLGLAVAWSLALLLAACLVAWRGATTTRIGPHIARADAVLVAALVCALVGSWIEAQVGVPTISTRLIGAVYAAIILLVCIDTFGDKAIAGPAADAASPGAGASAMSNGSADAPGDSAGDEPAAAGGAARASGAASNPPAVRSARKRKRAKAGQAQVAAALARSVRPTIVGWLVGLGLIVVTAGYFPPLSGTVIHPPSPQRLHLIIVPLLWMMAAGAVFAWYEARRTAAGALEAATRFLLWMAVPWFIFILAYAQAGGAIRGAGDALVGERINVLLMLSFASYPAMVGLLGLVLYRVNPLRDTDRSNDPNRIGPAMPYRGSLAGQTMLAMSLLACIATYWAAMTDVRADTYAKLATWAQSLGRPEVATTFYKQAADLLPQERRFTGSYAARLVEKAAQDIGALPANPALAPPILERLALAEQAINMSRKAAPRDPWVTFAYANVKQFQAIGVLEPHLPKGVRAQNVATAREYFAIARKQFPGHPWLLRNWAQLEIDQGNRDAGYKMFDQMEQLDPLNVINYSERLRFTRAFGDHGIAIAALRRGIAAQPAGSAGETHLKLELARYFQQTGQLQQALVQWLDILQTQPDEIDIAANVTEAYAQLGQRELALGNAQAALARVATLPRAARTDAAKARLESQVARLMAAATGPRAAAAGAVSGATPKR